MFHDGPQNSHNSGMRRGELQRRQPPGELRRRKCARAKTAACAGAAMWFMNYALGGVFPVITHMFPLGLATVTLLIGLAEAIVAGLAGAWLYKETV
jgi:hypothetical protein